MELSEPAIAFTALLISIGAFCFSLLHYRDKNTKEAMATNLASLAEIDLFLGELPSLIRFHGITETDIANAGIKDVKELAYIVASLHAGKIYYYIRGDENKQSPFKPKDTYRFNMCSSPAFIKAWPVVQRFLMDCHYKTRIDNTVRQYQNLVHCDCG